MRRSEWPVGTPQWWEEHRARAKEVRARARREGCSSVDADLRAAEYFHPLRDVSGDIGAEGALWQGHWYGVAARDAEKSGATDRARWYRREAIRGYSDATRSRDGWARDYAFTRLLEALDREGDGRAMRAALDRWKRVVPEHAAQLERDWRDRVVLDTLAPLTDAERQRVIDVMVAWAARHPAPDEAVATLLGAKDMSPRTLAHHLRANTETGEALIRSFASRRGDRSLDAALSVFAREFLPQAHASHLRRYPVAVRARGRAVEWASLDSHAAVDTFAWERMKRAEAFGFSRPGEHRFSSDWERATVLFVPLTADAKAYPRSVNRVAIRLVRVARPTGSPMTL